MRTNEEVKRMFGQLDIVTAIKRNHVPRNHVQRIMDNRDVRKVLIKNPGGRRRRRGRFRKRWVEDVEELPSGSGTVAQTSGEQRRVEVTGVGGPGSAVAVSSVVSSVVKLRATRALH